MDLGAQIFTLSALVEGSKWLSTVQFDSPLRATSWNLGRMPIYHYTLLTKLWACPLCTFLNSVEYSSCDVCAAKSKSVRILAKQKRTVR